MAAVGTTPGDMQQGPALEMRVEFQRGAAPFTRPQAAGCMESRGCAPQGTRVSVPLVLLLLGGAARPLSCTPTAPLLLGKSFLVFRLSREPVWTACSTMGLLPAGTDGKAAPTLGRRDVSKGKERR